MSRDGSFQVAVTSLMEDAAFEQYQPFLGTPLVSTPTARERNAALMANYFEIMRQEYNVSNAALTWRSLVCIRDFYPHNLRRFVPRLLAALCVFYFGVYVNNLAQAWLQENLAGFYEDRWPPNTAAVQAGSMGAEDTVRLWDVGHVFLPKLHSTYYCDVFAGGAPIALFIRFVVLPGPYSLRWTILCRWFVLWGVLFLCRALVVCLTPLPNPDRTCKPRISFPGNIWMQAYANLPLIQQLHSYDEQRTCQDVLFSGHTVSLTLSMMFFFKYIRLAPWFECTLRRACCSGLAFTNVVGSIVLVCGYYVIVASHFHYSVDVLVAAMMTFLVVQAYHYAMQMAWLCSPRRYCSVYRLLLWFERYAKDLRIVRRTMAMRMQDPDFLS